MRVLAQPNFDDHDYRAAQWPGPVMPSNHVSLAPYFLESAEEMGVREAEARRIKFILL